MTPGRPAQILITASLAGLASFPGGGAYGPSKHVVVAVAEQAALALQGTAVGVSLLCPALVRSGMSEVGEDPLEVADQAIDALRRNRFAVVPQEWADTILDRARKLIAGEQPSIPKPGGL